MDFPHAHHHVRIPDGALLMIVPSLGILPGDTLAAEKLQADGFPAVGTYLKDGDPYYW